MPALETNYDQLEQRLREIPADEILCIMSITSCFAPREPDDAERIGDIAKKHGLFHLVNNAYGLQCSKTTEMLTQAMRKESVDYVV